ncbi:hypothetical protein GCM10017744_082740 [Streptomyces antimycoticus]|uniref:PucR C-terminal helix-turn-helix domain-containing protein n=2 Tax=Streptomyces antimycoticus TaxID=68175 RepID=A0A4D4K3U3_9ACTN|nr:hypothetical protein SANT12839_018610 [Streptomyces antimycoticus]
MIPAEETAVWSWMAVPDRPSGALADVVRAALAPPAGPHIALGPCAQGVEGMRRSRHGAREAERVARMGGKDWLTDYGEVRLVAPATADPEHARWFVRETLGPLAAGGTRMRELRETLRVYLATERSPRRAADGLHVVRNTVTYRVRAEELLPGSTREEPMGLHMALEIAQTLPG